MGTSVESAELAAPEQKPSEPVPSRERAPFLWLGFDVWIFLLLTVWLYHSILYRLVMQWANDQSFQHGFFVPAFAAYVLWLNRDHLKRIKTSPSWGGLPIVVFALVMLVLGVLGVELYTSRVSLLVLLAGLVVAMRGWPLFQAVLFPWAFSFLMIPLPKIILQQLTFPLQLLASQVSAWILWHVLNVPCFREGNQIRLPHQLPLQIVDACSGIRSLMSLITLAIIYGYLLETRKWVRVTLAVAAVPIAIAANILRIVVTGMLGRWDQKLAEGFYHEFQGWLVFIVALLMLYALHLIINSLWKPGSAHLAPRPAVASDEPARAQSGSAQFVIAAVLMLASGLILYHFAKDEALPPRQPPSSVPSQIGTWSGTDEPIDDATLEILGRNGEYLERAYVNGSNLEPWIDIFVAYYPSQKFGEIPHTPLDCLVGAGFTPIERKVVQLTSPHGPIQVNRLIAVKRDERELVIYWFQAHGRVVANEYLNKYHLIDDSIHMRRSDGGFVRLLTPMFPGESAEAAQERILPIINQIIPPLDRVIPR